MRDVTPGMWEGLEDAGWAGLRHNYGTAEDVPGLLRRCAGAESADVDQAAYDLENVLFHQGGWICPAAPAALPFLLRLATAPQVRCRTAVLDLVAMLAAEAGRVEERFLAPGWPAAWDRELPGVLALLTDPDPGIRRAVAGIAGACASPGAVLLPALLDRWRSEPDPVSRLDLVLALGQARTREPVGDRHDEAGALLHALLGSPEPQVRLAAVHALAAGDPGFAAGRREMLLAAVRDPSVALWRQSSTLESGAQGVQAWTAGLFPGASPAFTLGLLADHPDAEQRAGALAVAGGLLARWRSPGAALLPALAGRLADPDAEVRYRAVELLACLGPQAADHADAVAGLLGDGAARPDARTGETVGDTALWALARMNDPRCLPGLAEHIAGTRTGFAAVSAHHGGIRGRHWPVLPALHEVLARLPGHGETLLPAIRDRLATTADPAADKGTLTRLCDVLAAWGPAAAPAVPHLLDLLRNDETWPAAAKALAAVGPAAHAAREPLLARADAAVTGGHAALAAWAHWKTGGDPVPALRLLAPAAGDRFPRHTLRRLADLGPHAAPCVDVLRPLLTAADPWTSVEAAHALWSATGDTDDTVPVLLRAVRNLPAGTYLPVTLPAVHYLTRIGPPAQDAARLLRDLPDRRLHHNGAWRAFTEDEDIRHAVAGLLAG
ncbi:hypothetical protein [Streptomyces sp. NPDC004134]|uniref:hypothetical protein n=1 Tax=Streptomyces sp. NPDC004134 TaxID=3364691 RepID=UPI00369CB4AE